jgi:drug/metabolite transporter (DMT)-like permease
MPGGALPLLLYGGWGAWQVDPRSLSAVGWLSFCHVALLSGVLAFYCFYLGVRQIGAAGATLYQFSVPPMAALFGWWLLGQGLAPVQFLGFVAALVGVYVAQRARQ